MFEKYIGQKLERRVAFELFEGHSITGQSEYPWIIVERIFSSFAEAGTDFNSRHCCILQCKPQRESVDLIWQSIFELGDLIGVWNTGWPGDGTMSNEIMVLRKDGNGIFAESNMGPYYGVEFKWYVERNNLVIYSEDSVLCYNLIQYSPRVSVTSMGGETYTYTRLKRGCFGLEFYRETDLTPDEHEKNADLAYDRLLDDCDKEDS